MRVAFDGWVRCKSARARGLAPVGTLAALARRRQDEAAAKKEQEAALARRRQEEAKKKQDVWLPLWRAKGKLAHLGIEDVAAWLDERGVEKTVQGNGAVYYLKADVLRWRDEQARLRKEARAAAAEDLPEGWVSSKMLSDATGFRTQDVGAYLHVWGVEPCGLTRNNCNNKVKVYRIEDVIAEARRRSRCKFARALCEKFLSE